MELFVWGAMALVFALSLVYAVRRAVVRRNARETNPWAAGPSPLGRSIAALGDAVDAAPRGFARARRGLGVSVAVAAAAAVASDEEDESPAYRSAFDDEGREMWFIGTEHNLGERED